MCYDSGMERGRKRELRQLVVGLRDPRRGIGLLRSILQQLVDVLFLSSDFIGFALLVLVSFPISVPLAIIGNSFWGIKGGIGGAIIGVVVFLFWLYKTVLFEERTRLVGKEHDYNLCLWCQHPISGLCTQDACPECGKGFDLSVSQRLYKAHYEPPSYLSGPKVIKYRAMRDWARAIRERDRVRDE